MDEGTEGDPSEGRTETTATPEVGGNRWLRLPFARSIFDHTYLRADRALDRGQRHVFRVLWFFLPETSIAKDLRFQQVLASRFLSESGQQALAYGALVVIAQSGGSAFDLALIGAAGLVPAAVLGLHGGAVADVLPKRIALAATYTLQALLCFLVPLVGGSDLAAVVVLILAVNTLGQVSTPSESAVLPYVASKEQLASAASFLNLTAAAGAGVGAALLAPIVVRLFGAEPVMYLSGVILLVAGTRIFDLPAHEPERPVEWRLPNVSVRATVKWLAGQPAVTTMMVVGVLASTINVVSQTLGPLYVVEALHVDASNAVYVFAPSAAGLALALVLAPPAMERWGERIVALCGFLVAAVALVLLGAIDEVAPLLDPINPLRAGELVGLELERSLRAAAILAFPLGMGVALATTSVQTYVNRRLPLEVQGRAFALQGSLRSAVAIVPLLSLAAAAAAFGVERVLLVSPVLLVVLAYGLVLLSVRYARIAPSSHLEVLSSFWEEAPEPGTPDDHDTRSP